VWRETPSGALLLGVFCCVSGEKWPNSETILAMEGNDMSIFCIFARNNV
jgi:hypothetical protein